MSRGSKNRRGLTLLELIVVMMILVAVAGILVPAITGMVGRSHTSAGAANIAECANAIQRYEAQYLRYPNMLDSLKETLAGADATDFLGLGDELVAAIEPVDLDAATLAALNDAGITTVGLHADPSATADATFQVTSPGDLDATTVLLGPTAAQQVAMGLEAVGVAGKYVVLGIGQQNTAIGKTMLEAPVHFPENGTENPADVYNRFLAVFQILSNDATPAPLEKAQFVGIMSPHAGALNNHLEHYFHLVAEEAAE